MGLHFTSISQIMKSPVKVMVSIPTTLGLYSAFSSDIEGKNTASRSYEVLYIFLFSYYSAIH